MPDSGRRPGARPKLLDMLSRAIRARRYSPRTEEAYRRWVVRYVRFHGVRHPLELGSADVNSFLSHLAVDRNASASTQGQARAALQFLYREVLGKPLCDVGADAIVLGRIPKRLPVVLTRGEVAKTLREISGVQHLVASLLYGSGLRLTEALRLRAKDLDLERRELVVRRGKGSRDRVSVIPASLVVSLSSQIAVVKERHQRDVAAGGGYAPLPGRLAVKSPSAGAEFGWQFIFPSPRLFKETGTGRWVRGHLHQTSVQRAVRAAARSAGLAKRVTCHTFRHSFATHLLEDGYDIRTIQELLGHRSVTTTMIYTHVLNRGGAGVRSPLDRIPRL